MLDSARFRAMLFAVAGLAGVAALAISLAPPESTARAQAGDGPQATANFMTAIVGEAQLLVVLENDSAGGAPLIPASVTLVDEPRFGRASVLADGRIRYEAPAQRLGRLDRFSYTVRDAAGRTSAPTTVTAVLLEPPRLTASTRQLDFGGACTAGCERTVTLTNAGEAPIYVVGARLTEGAGFTSSGCEQATLTGTQPTCTIRIRYAQGSGSGSGELRIHQSAGAAIAVELAAHGGCEHGVPADRLALLDQRVGFGREVTGGAGGCLYRVTNANDAGPGSLRAGAEAGHAWIVFDGDFQITLRSNIAVAGNTTIDGRGRRIVIEGAGLHMVGAESSNVILANLTIRHAAGEGRTEGTGNDLIRIWRGASEFWLDHLTLADAADEYIDIGSTEAGRGTPVLGTVSWVRFNAGGPISSEDKAVIIGAEAGAATNHLLHVTLHHNWYNGTRQRHPLVNGGTVHSFNNVIRWTLWSMAVRHYPGGPFGARLLSERDVFDASAAPPGFRAAMRFVQPPSEVRISEPLLLNNARLPELAGVAEFVPGALYPYRLDPLDRVQEIVTSGAGAR